MNKYKIVGGLNLILGCLQILTPIIIFIVILPKMEILYRDFAIAERPKLNLIPYVFGEIVGVVNCYLAFNLFKGRKQYFAIGLIMLLSFVVLQVILRLSLTPLYGLYNQL